MDRISNRNHAYQVRIKLARHLDELPTELMLVPTKIQWCVCFLNTYYRYLLDESLTVDVHMFVKELKGTKPTAREKQGIDQKCSQRFSK